MKAKIVIENEEGEPRKDGDFVYQFTIPRRHKATVTIEPLETNNSPV